MPMFPTLGRSSFVQDGMVATRYRMLVVVRQITQITHRIWGPVKLRPKMTATEAINSHVSTYIFPLASCCLST